MKFTVIRYTHDRLPTALDNYCRGVLSAALPDDVDLVYVGVDRPPTDPRARWIPKALDSRGAYHDCYSRVLKGLEAAQCNKVFLVEHDNLYTREHFSEAPEPEEAVYHYQTNLWVANEFGYFSTRGRTVTAAVSAFKSDLLFHFDRSFKWVSDGLRIVWDEPGRSWVDDGIAFVASGEMVKWNASTPCLDIRYGGNLTGTRKGNKYIQTLPPFENHSALWTAINGGK